MGKAKSLKNGEARLEFVACRARVEEMLAQGHSISSIHAILTKDGIITMSYKTLQDKINKIGKAPRGTVTAIAPSRAAFAAVQAKPVAVAPPTTGMQFNLPELDEAMELAAARRAKEAKKSDGVNQPFNRKK